MKQLVSFCIKHRVTTMMACIVIVVFGVMGFGSLPPANATFSAPRICAT